MKNRRLAKSAIAIAAIVVAAAGCSADRPFGPPSQAHIEVSVEHDTINLHSTTQVHAVAYDSLGRVVTDARVTWRTTNPHLAVDSTGVVSANGNWGAGVFADTVEAISGGLVGRVAVFLQMFPSGRPTSIVLSIPRDTMIAQQSMGYTGFVADGNGDPAGPFVVQFSSTNTAVLTVAGSAGDAVAHDKNPPGVDSAFIEGRYDTLVVRRKIIVLPSIDRIDLPAGASLRAAGNIDTLRATVYSANGAVLTGQSLTWSSSNPAAVSVSQSGAIAFLSPGNATITASLRDHSTSVSYTVIAPYRAIEIPSVSAAAPIVAINENDDVLGGSAASPASPFFYHAGTTRFIPECTTPLSLNNRAQILCLANIAGAQGLAVWENGALHAVSGFPGIPADARMNDSGAVAFIADSGTVLCPNARCVGVWRDSLLRLDAPVAPTRLLHFDNAGNVGFAVQSFPHGIPGAGVQGGYFYSQATRSFDGFADVAIFGANNISTTAMNGVGGMVGYESFYHAPTSGFWRPPASVRGYLGLSKPLDVNDSNLAVGDDGLVRAGTDLGAPLSDLTVDPVWRPVSPQKISNRGAIVSTAVSRIDGHSAMILLTPSP